MTTTFGRRVLSGVCVCVACAATAALGQTKADSKKTDTITLTGCVARDEATPTQYTLEDRKGGGRFRLTGINLKDYVDKSVTVVGSKKLVIVGGLYPNANVAAQAGAMDPTRAAMAAQPGAAGPGNVTLPEFKVKSVRPVSGSCRN
jgi:hypothetical protein